MYGTDNRDQCAIPPTIALPCRVHFPGEYCCSGLTFASRSTAAPVARGGTGWFGKCGPTIGPLGVEFTLDRDGDPGLEGEEPVDGLGRGLVPAVEVEVEVAVDAVAAF